MNPQKMAADLAQMILALQAERDALKLDYEKLKGDMQDLIDHVCPKCYGSWHDKRASKPHATSGLRG